MNKEIICNKAYEAGLGSSVFVDVREKEELDRVSYDMPITVHIPLSQFENQYHLLSKEADLIIVCRTGRRSGTATAFLQNKGYSKVHNLVGGIINWEDKGLPVIRTIDKGIYESTPEAHPAFDSFIERIKNIVKF